MVTGIVLDNGGGLIKAAKVPFERNSSNPQADPTTKKAGLLEALTPDPLVVPNALAKPAKNALPIPQEYLGTSRRPLGFLVGGEINHAPDVSAMTFRRPVDRGVVALWDAQRDVWASVLSTDGGISLEDPSEAVLLVTEPLGLPLNMRFAMDQLVFEEFGFDEYSAVVPQRLAAAGANRSTALVLDSGFSFTHAVPVVDRMELSHCARRLNLGGKALTNHLKETVSFRSWNMMDETAVINAVKERLCYVSLSYQDELDMTKDKHNTIKRDYALPDFSRGATDPLGHVLSPNEELDGTEQVLRMNNERISVPEILFNPSDVGMEQAGVGELIFQAVQACPQEHHADLYANVVLTGGNCNFPNFAERVMRDLRPLVSDIYDIGIFKEDTPILTTFQGGVRALEDDSVPVNFVTKSWYEENGSEAVLRNFYGDKDKLP